MNRILNLKSLRPVLLQSCNYFNSIKLVNSEISSLIKNSQKSSPFNISFNNLNQNRFLSKKHGPNKDKKENVIV